MDKKPKAVYAPGELDRVRGNLGSLDLDEAKRIAQRLGGEVGVERTPEPAKKAPAPAPRARPGGAAGSGRGGREKASQKNEGKKKNDPGDDPSKPLKLGYFERVKMDRQAGMLDFEVKNGFQVLVSMFSFFSPPPDYINPRFITRNMKAHYAKLEKLVLATKTLLPKNNARRSARLKRVSPFAFRVLDTLSNWNIGAIEKDLARFQANPHRVSASDFSAIVTLFYKPLFLMELLDADSHIKESLKVLFKILQLESPMDAKEKYEPAIRDVILSFVEIRKDVHYALYPILMKLISDRFIPYDTFFSERRGRFIAFLNLTAQDQIEPEDLSSLPEIVSDDEDAEADAEAEAAEGEEGAEGNVTAGGDEDDLAGKDPNDPEVIKRKAEREADRAERKALEHSLATLEVLFPMAGWSKLDEFPDLYPYFADVYNLRRGFELIAPTDPMQQVSVLMHILEDIFFGLRYVKFNSVLDAGDAAVAKAEIKIGEVINHWRRYIDNSFYKDYLPRLLEYCRALEHSSGSRTSPFVRKIHDEIHWLKRLYFLPYYKFESIGPPPFKKQDVTTIYSEIRLVRKYLTSVAAGIEQGMRNGGAEAKAVCEGIGNPWERYVFEVPNPVSKRLGALLSPAKRNNANLVFFTLAAVTTLDYIVNNEKSWSYEKERPGPLFRSIRDEGTMPQFGVDEKLNADQIFKDVLKEKMAKSEAAGQ
ncbi:MAG: hypothetical protein FWG66_15470 [Spirochaetes bacterium]|nr:hypothetical protein [Spirochaetota bacterium]